MVDMAPPVWAILAILLVVFGTAVFVGVMLHFAIGKPRATTSSHDLAELREEVARLRDEVERLKRAQSTGSTAFADSPP